MPESIHSTLPNSTLPKPNPTLPKEEHVDVVSGARRSTIAVYLIPTCALATLNLVLESLQWTMHGTDAVSVYSEIATLLVFGSMLIPGVLWISRVRMKRRPRSPRDPHRIVWLFPLCSALLVASFVVGSMIHRSGQARALEASRTVAFAIAAFIEVHDEPPASLDRLVPRFLAELPSTHVGRFPEFGYRQGAEAKAEFGSAWAVFLEAGFLTQSITITSRGSNWEGAPGDVPFHVVRSVDFPYYWYSEETGPSIESTRYLDRTRSRRR